MILFSSSIPPQDPTTESKVAFAETAAFSIVNDWQHPVVRVFVETAAEDTDLDAAFRTLDAYG